MSRQPLTQVQKEIYDFIVEYHSKNKIMPRIRDIAKALSYESTSPVHCHIDNICNKGYMRKYAKQWRGLKLIDPILEKSPKIN